MERLRFFFKRLVRMDYKKFFSNLKILKNKSGKSYLFLITDLLTCALKYNAGYIDYKIAEMYKLNDNQRKTTITRGISNSIVKKMNDKTYWHYFDNKATFNTLFEKQVNRKWFLINKTTTKKELKDFIKNFDELMFKPLEGSSGNGIYKIYKEEWQNNFDSFFEKIKSKGPALLEEVIKQHDLLNELNPSSVNTIRIATLLGDKKQGIVYAFLRIGNGKVIDNVDCGGMAARVDLDSGTILTVGADKQGNVFEKHPTTNVNIVGFNVPYWEEAKEMCLEASNKIPQMRFIAWDVAICNDGPVLIEGNSFPSHAIPQFAAHYPDGIGILKDFNEFINVY